MYYASSHIHRPKTKRTCTLVTTDGEIYEGNFFCSGDQRLKDLLNGDAEFMPFETLGGAIYLINRRCIARVIERSDAAAKPAENDGERRNGSATAPLS